MAGLLAKLLVKLSADSAEFQSNMEKASKSSASFEAKARQSINNVAKAAGAMSVAVAGATAVIVKQNLQSIDSLAKTADKLGITTEKLTGLRHASELTGAGAQTMENGLRGMNMRLGQAAAGLGEAKKWIDSMGLSAQELMNMQPDQAFGRIADKINELGSQSEKTAAAAAMFGEQGIQLLNTINLGSEGLNAMSAEADALGLSLSRVDAAKVEAANDAITRSSAGMTALGQNITVQLAPYIEGIANKLTQAAKESGGFKSQISAALKAGIMGASRLADVWRGWELIFSGLKVAFAGLSMFVLRGLEQWDMAITDTVNLATDAVNKLIDGMNSLPGVELPRIETAQYSQDLGNLTRASEEYFDEVNASFMALASKPLPSESVKKWLEEVDQAAQVAAEKVAAASSGMQQAALTAAPTQAVDPEQQKFIERLQGRLLSLEESLRTEEESLQASYANRRDIVNTAFEDGLISQQRQFELLEKLALEHDEKLTAIKAKGETEREKFAKLSWGNQVKQVAGSLETMTQSVATQNKAMFRLNQAASLTMAVINTAEGVTKALAAYPPPLSFVMAAAVAAAGAVQIASIASASFGSASAAPSVASSGATSVTATTPLAGSAPSGSDTGQAVNFYIYGHVYDLDGTARTLYPALQRAANDGIARD